MEQWRVETLNGQYCQLRLLAKDDAEALSDFFINLSPSTRSKFAPHPLTAQYAQQLCLQVDQTAIRRFVLTLQNTIIGYFILDPNISEHDVARYKPFSIELEAGIDWLFAPCIADPFQSKGLAAVVMQRLQDYGVNHAMRSFVLMGGTQETNHKARAFYRKLGFMPYGGYQTDVYNIDMRLVL